METMPLSEQVKDTQELVRVFFELIDALPDADRAKCEDAFFIAMHVHQGQMRGDEPYINHVLRVAIRIAKNMPRFPDRIVAALLHDGPEDKPGRIGALTDELVFDSIQLQAFHVLREKYGDRVHRIVASMTNPARPEGISNDEWHAMYEEHVRHAIRDQDVFWPKLSDVYENAVRVHLNPDTKRRLKFTKKYEPIIQPFIDGIESGAMTDLAPEKAQRVIQRLQSTRENMRRFIAENTTR